MRKERWILVVIFCLCCFVAVAKDFPIRTQGQKLNVFLNELAEKEDLLISFDETAMSKITLPQKARFQSISDFFHFLQKAHYVQVDRVGDSFVLRAIEQKNYVFQGKVFDAETGESLPDAEVVCESFHTYTSPDGYFTFLTTNTKKKKVQIRHLGYVILDTVIVAKSIAKIPLLSRTENIGDVVIKTNLKSHNINVGSRSGALKLTPQFIRKLPGYGESSIYSFLKLMPGVLATGESVTDMSFRGSTEGQNSYVFDNYRVYNPWYRLNEIGTINPLLIKDIEVYKAGLDASVGENVGGIVLMKGIEAVPKKVQGQVFVNNFIANGMLEVPLNEKMALVVAGRKNIAEELKIPDAVGEYTIKNTFDGFADNYLVTINPKYNLYDANLKFIYKINANSNLSVSGFGSKENNKLDATTFTNDFHLKNRQDRHNEQYAGAIHYSNYNEEGKQFAVTASYSEIKSGLNGLARVLKLNKKDPTVNTIRNEQSSFLQEFRIKAKRQIPLWAGGALSYGLGFTASHIEESKKLEEDAWNYNNSWHQLSYAFVNSRWHFLNKWDASVGGRLNYSGKLKKFSVEPRLALSYYPNDAWKIYTSYGVFQQFVYSTNVFDNLKNLNYLRVCAQDDIPVFQLHNFCLGVRYAQKAWVASAELFYKKTDEKIRATYLDRVLNDAKLQKDKVQYVGGDFLFKYQKKGFIGWISYTLSDFREQETKQEEKQSSQPENTFKTSVFSNFYSDYEHSDYDMRQELKGAVAYTWHNLTASTSYIYGSGFRVWHQPSAVGAPDYSRLDLGASYKLKVRKFDTEFGFSVLNVLNRENKKLDEFSRFGVGNDIVSYNTYGLKRTLALFLKVKF